MAQGLTTHLLIVALCVGVGIAAFYALTEILQGPRHRFQVAFIFAWVHFCFLWQLLSSRATSGRRASLPQWSAAYP